MKQTKLHKFNNQWLHTYSPWLIRDRTGGEKPFCIYCKCNIFPTTNSLVRHATTQKHIYNAEKSEENCSSKELEADSTEEIMEDYNAKITKVE